VMMSSVVTVSAGSTYNDSNKYKEYNRNNVSSWVNVARIWALGHVRSDNQRTYNNILKNSCIR
jgi:hypothetical protein